MASFNRVILIGNITRDLEIRQTPQGHSVLDLGLAVNDRYKTNGELVDHTTFVDCVLWNKTAEVASEYLRKGDQVLIEGKLKLDQWEKDGEKRSRIRVICQRMVMLGSKNKQIEDTTEETPF